MFTLIPKGVLTCPDRLTPTNSAHAICFDPRPFFVCVSQMNLGLRTDGRKHVLDIPKAWTELAVRVRWWGWARRRAGQPPSNTSGHDVVFFTWYLGSSFTTVLWGGITWNECGIMFAVRVKGLKCTRGTLFRSTGKYLPCTRAVVFISSFFVSLWFRSVCLVAFRAVFS